MSASDRRVNFRSAAAHLLLPQKRPREQTSRSSALCTERRAFLARPKMCALHAVMRTTKMKLPTLHAVILH